jgi:hypothetical protein
MEQTAGQMECAGDGASREMRNSECGMRNVLSQPTSAGGAARGAWLVLGLLLFTISPVIGCASHEPTTQPSESSRLSDRAHAAERDPFNYKPENDRTDISGGGLDHFDKDAFRKDMDSVFNP